ncbi:MAG TPA: PqqD family protein [Gemmatimonadaceae bacterium]
MNALTLDTTVVASRDQVAANLAEEVIILGMRDGVYYGVDGVAARVWALVQQPARLGDVVHTLLQEYEVAAESCEAEVIAFVAELEASGLVTRVAHRAP